ncbi:MAG: CPBP family intramembrane metalloprotease [Dethiosulfatibacter sp.]|nr:CPBP family intramembrane metalloprotease [Dethiosulfatibacter sp.]
MNFSNIRKIIGKEILALSRNKRVLFGLLAPLILMPVLFYGYNQFTEITSRESESSISHVVVIGNLPQTVRDSLSEHQQLDISNEPIKSDELDSVESDLILSYEFKEGVHDFVLTYDSGRAAGMRASNRVLPLIETFQETQQLEFLNEKGIAGIVLHPVEIDMKDSASEKELSGYSMASIVPMMLTLFAILSVLNFAVELTTAEKEMGTLESLFSIPIRKAELVTAKLIACILFGVTSMSISLSALVFIIPRLMDVNQMGLSLDLFSTFTLFLTLLPLILIGAGFSIGVGLFASSYKESGAYMTPLIFAFMIPAYIGITPGLEINPILSIIPVLNSTLLIKSVLMDNLSLTMFVMTFTTNALLSVIGLTFMFKVFGTERILFGSDSSTSFRLNRKSILRKTFIEVEDVLMSLSFIVIIYIYVGTIISSNTDFIQGTLIIQYMVFGLSPIAILWYLKASIKDSLGIKAPSITGLFGGFWVWIAAFSLVIIYQLMITPYVSQAPTLVELEQQMKALSPLRLFLIIALTPGVCEEILFRGFALRPLEKKLGPKWAVLITSLAFAIVHLDFIRLIPTFILGVAFGFVAVKTRSIFPSIILHTLNNSVAILFPYDKFLTYGYMIPVFIISLLVVFIIFRNQPR